MPINRCREMRCLREHFTHAVLSEIEYPFHEEDKLVLDIFFVMREEELIEKFIFDIENRFNDIDHHLEYDSVPFGMIRPEIARSHHIQ